MSWTWKWFDLMIVVAGVVIGLAVWFIPNMMNSPEMKELVAVSKERKEQQRAHEALQAEIKKEREEQGLVFLAPVTAPEQKSTPAKAR
jgi:sugar phosphate permease